MGQTQIWMTGPILLMLTKGRDKATFEGLHEKVTKTESVSVCFCTFL